MKTIAAVFYKIPSRYYPELLVITEPDDFPGDKEAKEKSVIDFCKAHIEEVKKYFLNHESIQFDSIKYLIDDDTKRQSLIILAGVTINRISKKEYPFSNLPEEKLNGILENLNRNIISLRTMELPVTKTDIS